MSQGGTSPTAERVHAILWRTPGHATPRDLAEALKGRGIAWEEATGPFDALARLLASRTPAIARVLLLLEPDGLPQIPAILRALERYDPAAGCWAYRASGTPRLAPFVLSSVPTEPEIVVRPAHKPSNGMKLRLSGEGPGVPRPTSTGPVAGEGTAAEPPAPEPDSPRSVLTPEELEMLLADDRD